MSEIKGRLHPAQIVECGWPGCDRREIVIDEDDLLKRQWNNLAKNDWHAVFESPEPRWVCPIHSLQR